MINLTHKSQIKHLFKIFLIRSYNQLKILVILLEEYTKRFQTYLIKIQQKKLILQKHSIGKGKSKIM